MYGITGAALASMISLVFSNVYSFIVVYQKIRITPFNKKSLYSLILLGPIIISLFYNPILFENNIISVVIKSLFLSMFFLLSVLKIKLSEDLSQLFKSFIKKIN
jgi:hypothetical protein